MKTYELINRLTAEAKPVRIMPGYYSSILLWTGVTVVWLVFIGFTKGHLATKTIDVSTLNFFLTVALPLLSGLLAGWLALNLTYPGQTEIRFYYLIPALILILALVSFVSHNLVFSENYISNRVELRGAICVIATILFASMPLFLLLYHLKKGALLNSTLGAVMAALSALSLGLGGVNLACDIPDFFHSLTFHYLPALLLAIPVVTLGIKRLRW